MCIYHEAFWIKCESAFLFGSHSMCNPFCCRLVSQSAKTLPVSHVECLPIVSTDNNKMASNSSAGFFRLQPSSIRHGAFLGCAADVWLHWHDSTLLIHYCIPSCQHSSFFGHICIYSAHERRCSRNTFCCMGILCLNLTSTFFHISTLWGDDLQRKLLTWSPF